MASVAKRIGACNERLRDACDAFDRLGIVLSSADNTALEAHLTAIESALEGVDLILGYCKPLTLDEGMHELSDMLAKQLDGNAPEILADLKHAVYLVAEKLLVGHQHGPDAYWARDGNGIELCKVCSQCETFKLARYRPEILRPYTQADVDEPIEPEE